MLRHLPQLVCLAVGLVLTSLSSVHAGVVGRAEINLKSLEWTLNSFDKNDSLTVQFTDYSGSVWGSAHSRGGNSQDEEGDPPGFYAYVEDQDTPLAGNKITELAWAEANRTSLLLSAAAGAEAGESAAAPDWNVGLSAAIHAIGLTITGHGEVVFSVGWSLHVEGVLGDDENLATVSAGLEFERNGQRGGDPSRVFLYSSEAEDKTMSGTLQLSYTNEPGMMTSGTLMASVDARAINTNIVPEPSTFALTGLGLMTAGLAVCRRRR